MDLTLLYTDVFYALCEERVLTGGYTKYFKCEKLHLQTTLLHSKERSLLFKLYDSG